jgi:hypothetical protein
VNRQQWFKILNQVLNSFMKVEMFGKRHLDHNVLSLVALGRVDSKIPVSPRPVSQELLLFWLIIVNEILALYRLKGYEKSLSCLLNFVFCWCFNLGID